MGYLMNYFIWDLLNDGVFIKFLDDLNYFLFLIIGIVSLFDQRRNYISFKHHLNLIFFITLKCKFAILDHLLSHLNYRLFMNPYLKIILLRLIFYQLALKLKGPSFFSFCNNQLY